MSAQRRGPASRGVVPVAPARRPVLLINPLRGAVRAQRARLADLARERGIVPVTLWRRVTSSRRSSSGRWPPAPTVSASPGVMDRVVASAAAGRRIPFACVPAGARNQFARDVGVAPSANASKPAAA